MPAKPDEHSRRESLRRERGRPVADTVDDESLINSCLRGDQRAWRELINRYSRLVYSIPRRYGLDESSTDDVFQTVFANLFKRLGDLRDPKTLPKWLMTAASRASWKVLREKRREAPSDNNDVQIDVAETPAEDQLVQWERQHLVRQALARLGGNCQPLLEALYLNPAQPSYEQISRQLGIAVGSIGPTRARCLAKLLEICEDLGFE